MELLIFPSVVFRKLVWEDANLKMLSRREFEKVALGEGESLRGQVESASSSMKDVYQEMPIMPSSDRDNFVFVWMQCFQEFLLELYFPFCSDSLQHLLFDRSAGCLSVP